MEFTDEELLVSQRGIPVMDVIEDIPGHLKSEGISIEEARGRIDEQYRKYQLIESSMAQQKLRLLEKEPEFKSSLKLIKTLIASRDKNQPFETSTKVAEEVWTKAIVKEPKTISIWIGANIMVEYDFEAAQNLILKNREILMSQLNEINRELAFVKNQITTAEVNIAHLHNYFVKERTKMAKMASNA